MQYNALVVLGLLDQTYATPSNPNAAPLPAANQLLNSYAVAGATGRAPRRVLVGALVGLGRHAKLLANLPEANRTATLRSLFGLTRAKELPGDYEPGVREWVAESAAGALAGTGQAGPGGRFFLTIARRAGDDALDLDVRARLASFLALMPVQAGAFDGTPAANAVQQLAIAIAKDSRELAEEYEELQLAGGRQQGVANLRANTARRYRIGQEGPELVREGLLARLTDLRKAAVAVQPVAGDEYAATMGALPTALDGALTPLQDKNEIDLNLTAALKQMADAIEAAAKPAAAVGAADEADVEF